MNVVYASNDNYARHLAVSLYSLYDHNQDRKTIVVYILSMGLTEETKRGLCQVAETFDRKLEFIELGDLKARFACQVDTGGFDLSIMARLFVGEVLPQTVERVLYLDCDTVVLKPLKGLWNTNLHGCVIGAVMEPTIYPVIRKQIGLGEADPYFNSGVLLIDMKRWREEEAQKTLLDFYQKMGGTLFAGDQDTINGALKGKIRPMSPVYNFFTNYRYFHYAHLVRLSSLYEKIPKETFRKAKKHPVIVHYMGDERPWIAGNLNHYGKAYDHYLKFTPWAGAKKEKGKRLYMVFYHLMDYTTFLCPPARDIISRKFGMAAINSRKGV